MHQNSPFQIKNKNITRRELNLLQWGGETCPLPWSPTEPRPSSAYQRDPASFLDQFKYRIEIPEFVLDIETLIIRTDYRSCTSEIYGLSRVSDKRRLWLWT